MRIFLNEQPLDWTAPVTSSAYLCPFADYWLKRCSCTVTEDWCNSDWLHSHRWGSSSHLWSSNTGHFHPDPTTKSTAHWHSAVVTRCTNTDVQFQCYWFKIMKQVEWLYRNRLVTFRGDTNQRFDLIHFSVVSDCFGETFTPVTSRHCGIGLRVKFNLSQS